MGLFAFAIAWMVGAVALFDWLFWLQDWWKLPVGGIAWRTFACSVGFSPGLVAMHEVAVLPLVIALMAQPGSDLLSWSLLSWFIVFVSSVLVATFLTRLGPNESTERSVPNTP
jgi:hypothetical protein